MLQAGIDIFNLVLFKIKTWASPHFLRKRELGEANLLKKGLTYAETQYLRQNSVFRKRKWSYHRLDALWYYKIWQYFFTFIKPSVWQNPPLGEINLKPWQSLHHVYALIFTLQPVRNDSFSLLRKASLLPPFYRDLYWWGYSEGADASLRSCVTSLLDFFFVSEEHDFHMLFISFCPVSSFF